MALKKTTAKKSAKPAVKVVKKTTVKKEAVKTTPVKKAETKAETPKVEVLNPFIYPIGKCKFRLNIRKRLSIN